MSRSLVSVIIVNWNGANYLETCLISLTRQTHRRIEIIVVDNASTDNSFDVLTSFRAQYPRVPLRVILNDRNKGFCYGNNQGIRLSSGEFIFLLNADVSLEPPFIEKLVAVMREERQVGIAVGKLLNGHDPTLIDSAGLVMRKNRRAADRGQREPDHGQYAAREEVFGASGAACLYRRAMLESLKYSRSDLGMPADADSHYVAHDEYLDELFFAYKEDVDLSWRAQLAGWKCVYTPDAVGYHFRKWGEGNRQQIPKWIRRQSLKNRYVMLLKNERFSTFLPSCLHIALYELLSLGFMLLREPYLFVVVKDLLELWPSIMKKRKLTQRRIRQKSLAPRLLRWFK